MKKIFLIILVNVCLSLCSFPLCYAKLAGKIASFSGEVSWRDKANVPYKKAKEGMDLKQDADKEAGKDGWAKLSLSDGSAFTLANNTELEIDKFVVSTDKKKAFLN